MLKELKDSALLIGLEFRPEFISLDFERGAINAFQFAFPQATIIGCWFHYGQCLYRTLCDLGLKVQYSKDEELKKTFQYCVALALISPCKVCEIFVDIIMDRAVSLLEKYPKLEKFFEYMTTNWIDEPLFSLSIWNHWSHLETRTNNNNEAYNLRIEKRFGSKPHPNIWSFIEQIQKEELHMQVKLKQINIDTYRPRGRCKKDITKDLYISNAKNVYLESSKSTEDLETLLEDLRVCVPNF